MLPLAIAAWLVPPVKGAVYKFTLETNRPPLPLPQLFEDMVEQPGMTQEAAERGGGSGVLSFWYPGVEDSRTGAPIEASILVSKNAGRYRVQSECFPALCLLASELVRRLKEHFGEGGGGGGAEGRGLGWGNGGGPGPGGKEGEKQGGGQGVDPLRVEYTEPLPLQDVYAMIDEHFERRVELLRAQEGLNAVAHEFRMVEKRLLVRFKDRNPTPLDSLDVVMEETYIRLLELGEGVERAQGRLRQSSNFLSCAVRLLALLMQCRFQLGMSDHALLLAHLQPDVTDTEDQGWEEAVDASMTHLLRTTLAKTVKESSTTTAQQPIVMPADTSKLKKHISIVCDRLNKGARLAFHPKSGPPSSSAGPSKADV
ncbi:unnamed protein product, partial [Discosporangium mesarthrocarpum]